MVAILVGLVGLPGACILATLHNGAAWQNDLKADVMVKAERHGVPLPGPEESFRRLAHAFFSRSGLCDLIGLHRASPYLGEPSGVSVAIRDIWGQWQAHPPRAICEVAVDATAVPEAAQFLLEPGRATDMYSVELWRNVPRPPRHVKRIRKLITYVSWEAFEVQFTICEILIFRTEDSPAQTDDSSDFSLPGSESS